MVNALMPSSFPAPGPLPALDRWRAASGWTPAATLLGAARSLGVIVPHADDETLGCGGLIATASAMGIDVTVTILTDGAASHPESLQWPPARLAHRRRQEARTAVAILSAGTARLVFANAPDGALADHPEVAASVPPADCYVSCWRDDPHPDHQAAFAVAVAVATAHAAPLFAFPLWVLDTDLPVPDLAIHRIDVTPHMARKRRALAAHASQLGQLVTDDPGFILDDPLQQLFLRPDELLIAVR
ncbi:hypothetical protein GCM10007973_11140 [Polymorphobacter multimanifer]|uniref:LmbE family N-acetylglucosaminyl deacetylase n=1 Tax=Polymorphobacter multimanifer TaxID=1070431 RepID=A0A841L3U1_9SPHN|nr:PIG-L family deacetylase [Polymorphobacter multimanifer]MBB6226111.1 LmbE family N-acetylglucosaminyl deacetylase [Polymorphobacter multimanifer]GGI76076.1 hypothetical protein GCM10007973_11140 [Polymorphobacter multimanifer]